MNRAMLEDHLVAAERHLAEAECHVTYRRELLARLGHDAHDIALATRLLKEFEEVLAMHIADRDQVRKKLGLAPC